MKGFESEKYLVRLLTEEDLPDVIELDQIKPMTGKLMELYKETGLDYRETMKDIYIKGGESFAVIEKANNTFLGIISHSEPGDEWEGELSITLKQNLDKSIMQEVFQIAFENIDSPVINSIVVNYSKQ